MKIRKRKKKRKFVLKLLAILLGILVIMQFSLYFFGEALFGEYIKLKIDNSTKGKYQVEYNYLRINPLMFGIKFKDVIINKLQQNQERIDFNTLSFESINITGIKIFKFIDENKIDISKIRVFNPTISLIKHDNRAEQSENKSLKISQLEQNIKEALLASFKQVKIDYFSMQKNSIDNLILINDKIPDWLPKSANKLNLIIKGFHVPSESDKDNIFFTSDILLNGEELSYFLNADDMKIKTSKFFTSFKNGHIAFHSLSVENRTDQGQYTTILSMPKFVMELEDLHKVIDEKSVIINKIEIIDAIFAYNALKNINKGKNNTTFDIININSILAKNVLGMGINSLILNELSIKNGSIDISKNASDDYYKVDKANVHLTGLKIDSSNYNLHDRFLFSNQLQINTGKISMINTVNNLKIDSESLSFNSKEKNIKILKVMIEDNKDIKNRNKLFFGIPKIEVNGFDFFNYYKTRDIDINSLTIFRPKIKLFQSKYKNKKSNKTQSIFKDLDRFFSKLKIKSLHVKNANVMIESTKGKTKKSLTTKFSSNDVSLFITQLKINSNPKVYSYSSTYDFKYISSKIKNFQMNLSDDIHLLKVHQIDISTRRKNILALNADIIPIKNDRQTLAKIKIKKGFLFDVSFPRIMLENVDFKKIYKYRKMDIESIEAQKPNVKISLIPNTSKNKESRGVINPYPLIKNILEYIHVEDVKFIDGYFTVLNLNDGKKIVEQKGTTINANFFKINSRTHFDKNSIFYSKKITGKINKYIINLPDNVHKLEINNLVVDSRKEMIKAQSARVYPSTHQVDTVKSVKAFYNIYAPDIKFNGVNIKNIYNNHTFKALLISLQSPNIHIIINENHTANKKKRKWQDYQKSMPNRINELEISKFDISEGNLKISSLKGKESTPFLGTKVKLNLNNVRINNEVLRKVDKIFYAKEFYLQMNNFSLDFNNNQKVLTANQINIELRKNGGSFFASDFHLFTNNKNKKNNLGSYNIFMPVLTLEEFDFDKAMLKKKYDMKTLTIVDAEIEISQNKSEKTSIHINQHLKNIVPKEIKLSIGKANINNANVNIKHGKNKKSYNGVNLMLENLKLSSEDNSTRKILFSDDVSLIIPKLYFKTSDSLYVIKTNKVKISTSKKYLRIDSLRFIPRYTHEIFTKKVSYQTDRMNFGISNLECKGIDYKKYLNDNEIHIKSLVINRFKLEIDRDKNFRQQEKVKKPNSIHGMLKNIKLPFTIKKMYAKDGKIIYREIPKKGKFPLDAATIPLSSVNIEGSNVQNMSSKSKKLNVTLTAKLLKKAGLKVTVVNKLNSDKMRVFGDLQTNDLMLFNPVLLKLANISISSGNVHNLSYDFNTDRSKAQGTMFFTYDNLKISVNKDNGRRHGFTSFLANTFIINSSNKQGSQYKKGIVKYKKIPYRGPINYIIKSIFTGIQNSIGINSNTKTKKKIKEKQNN